MKSNLHALYETNTQQETLGNWFMVSETAGFRLRRFGGANSNKLKQAMAKYHKPYAYQIEKGTLSLSKENELMSRAFVESCMTDWKGIEVDGKEVEFSVDAAVDLLKDLPELTSTLITYAQDAENFKDEVNEQVGNS